MRTVTEGNYGLTGEGVKLACSHLEEIACALIHTCELPHGVVRLATSIRSPWTENSDGIGNIPSLRTPGS